MNSAEFCSKLAAMSRCNSICLPCKQNHQLHIHFMVGLKQTKWELTSKKKTNSKRKGKEKVQQKLSAIKNRRTLHCLFLSNEDSRFNPKFIHLDLNYNWATKLHDDHNPMARKMERSYAKILEKYATIWKTKLLQLSLFIQDKFHANRFTEYQDFNYQSSNKYVTSLQVWNKKNGADYQGQTEI